MRVVSSEPVRLTELTSCGGCAAKWGASLLGELVAAASIAGDADLLVGLAPSDDAAVGQVAEVVVEAGGVVAGGHTIRSPEPIFGLAVQGVVVPGEQFTKGGARPDDVLVLSKPLGTGLALASGDPQTIGAAISTMRQLNRLAAGVLRRHRSAVHAVTDVTGFGLLGHGWEVAERSDAHLVFDASSLPLIDGVLAVAAAGGRTGGGHRNRGYVEGHVALAAGETAAAIGFDPQTSGGLLAAVDFGLVDELPGAGFVAVGRAADGPAAVTLR